MDDDPFRDGLLEVLRIGGIIDSFASLGSVTHCQLLKCSILSMLFLLKLSWLCTLLYSTSKQEQKYNTYNH